MRFSGTPMKGMAKQVTGIFLLGVMALLITLKHPALNYCLCLDSLTLVEHGCAEEVVDKEAECGSCCASESYCDSQGAEEDCLVSLIFDAGEFTHAPAYFDVDAPMESDTEVAWETHDLLVNGTTARALPIRGSPEGPPPQTRLYTAYSVYLI